MLVGLEVVFGERVDLRRPELGLESLHVDFSIARHANGQRFDAPIRMAQLDDDVLQCVGGGPRPVGAPQVVAGVEQVDEGLDRRRVRRVGHQRRGRTLVRDGWGSGNAHGLGVGGVVTVGAAHVRVFAGLHRRKELFAGRSTHRPAHRRNDHVRQAEAIEGALIGDAVPLIADLQTLVGEIEAVRVLHHELAAAQQAGARAGLVTELGLDLIDHQR